MAIPCIYMEILCISTSIRKHFCAAFARMATEKKKARYRHPVYALRMPPELKERLTLAADVHRRSLHAEILGRLENSFPSEDESDDFANKIETVASDTTMLREFIDILDKMLKHKEEEAAKLAQGTVTTGAIGKKRKD